MKNLAKELLTEAFLNLRPVVLFAGQNIEHERIENNPILHSLLEKVGCTDISSGWRGALKPGLAVSDLAWLTERFDRNVPTDAATIIYEAPWSAVFTSSIDPRFVRRFASRGRQPEAVLSRDTYARTSRSRSRPPVYYLLGKSDESVPDACAPRKIADLKRRVTTHATELMNRAAETATTLGLVVVAGYDHQSDWFPIDDLLAPLSHQDGIKVLWFGDISGADSDIANEMVEKGQLFFSTTTLAASIFDLQNEGKIDFSGAAAPDEPGTVSIAKGALDITPALRLRVEASAFIVDDSWTEPPEPLNASSTNEAFRRFHGDLGNFRNLVEGVAQGFSINRDFENKLWQTVESTIPRLSSSDGVILVHGQSGTGKSIAVARLTLNIRNKLKLPVVVSTSRIPAFADIDAFCSEAERVGATATVVICDANQLPHRYRDLAVALQSRGRRALIVGTSYKIEQKNKSKISRFVEAPAEISVAEKSLLKSLTANFGHRHLLDNDSSDNDSNILALLYRNLSAGRERITAGISGEARATESAVREKSRNVPAPIFRSAIAEALIKAEVSPPSAPLFQENTELAAFGQDASGRLIDYVMVAGRLSCPVPLNLIMRALCSRNVINDLSQIAHLFSDVDLFRWRESDGEGSGLLISPRIQLEAELICRRRLGDPTREVECLIDLIRNVRPTGVDRESERTFLLDLLQKLDREGPRGDVYQAGYLSFANALRDLREHHGVIDAALMLRECVFRRQTVWSLDGRDATKERSESERLEILNDARDIVEKALQLIESRNLYANKRTKLNLAAERASIYGYLAVQRTRSKDAENSWSDYCAARTASAKAIALSGDYHAIDITLWTASDILKAGNLSIDREMEVLADLISAVDLVDEGSLPPDQRSRYFERKLRVGNVIGDHQMSVESLKQLEAVAPSAAAFLIAKQKIGNLFETEPPYSEHLKSIATQAADYMAHQAPNETKDDRRCQRLLLQLRWVQATGERLFSGERGKTPSEAQQVANLLDVVHRLNERLGSSARNQERFLEAVLSWISGDISRSLDLWRSLSRDTEYEDRSRVIRRLLLTDGNGLPVRFRGRVEVTKGSNDWKVRIEGKSSTIGLLERDFRGDELAHGRELRDFGIAFNYVGPIADPLTRTVSKR